MLKSLSSSTGCCISLGVAKGLSSAIGEIDDDRDEFDVVRGRLYAGTVANEREDFARNEGDDSVELSSELAISGVESRLNWKSAVERVELGSDNRRRMLHCWECRTMYCWSIIACIYKSNQRSVVSAGCFWVRHMSGAWRDPDRISGDNRVRLTLCGSRLPEKGM